MENKFTEQVAIYTDARLKEVVMNPQQYQGSLISAAKRELAARGIELSEDEKKQKDWNKIEQIVDAHRHTDILKYYGWRYNIVNDPETPELYSRLFIWIVSVFFFNMLGGVLMSMNLHRLHKKEIPQVLLFCLAADIAILLLRKYVGGITLHLVSAYILTDVCWKKYIGMQQKYRPRPIIVLSVILGLIFSALLYYYIIHLE